MRSETDIGIDRAIRLVDRTRRAAKVRRAVAAAHSILVALAILIAAGKAWGIFA